MFDTASRLKLRFETSRGCLSVEDLWDLPLKASARGIGLYDIGNALHAGLKAVDSLPFSDAAVAADETAQLRFDIVKHVIEVKTAERNAAVQEKTKAEQKQRIMAILAQKEGEELAGKSADELRGLLASL